MSVVGIISHIIKYINYSFFKIGSVEKSNNMDGNMDGSGAIVDLNVEYPIIGWNSIAKIDLQPGKWELQGYCAIVSDYSDLALVGFGLSESLGSGQSIAQPIIIGQINNDDTSQPVYPTILQYTGRTYGSESLYSLSAGTCQNMIINISEPTTYYLNYAILDDVMEDTFVNSELIIYPLISATCLGSYS